MPENTTPTSSSNGGSRNRIRRRSDLLVAWSTVLIPLALVMLLIAAVLSTVLLVGYNKANATANRADENSARLQRVINKLDGSENTACMRLQLQRERANVSDARQFLILYVISHNPKGTPAVKRTFQSYVDSTQYFPPTDCPQAVEQGKNYHAPPAIKYSDLGVSFAQKVQQAAANSTGKHFVPQPIPECWKIKQYCTAKH